MREKPLVLVVDDDENFLEIITAKLKGEMDVAVAKNGAEGIKQAEKLLPDLILMDIRMPGATGTDAALAIKQNPKLEGIKIAFLTSLENPWPAITADHKEVSKELGMEDYIQKSEDLDVIMGDVRKLLSESRDSAPTPPPLPPTGGSAAPAA